MEDAPSSDEIAAPDPLVGKRGAEHGEGQRNAEDAEIGRVEDRLTLNGEDVATGDTDESGNEIGPSGIPLQKQKCPTADDDDRWRKDLTFGGWSCVTKHQASQQMVDNVIGD